MKLKKLMIKAIIILLLFISCSSEKSDFVNAVKFNTIDSYEKFLDSHPGSEFKDIATERIYYLTAVAINERWVFEDFLKKYPVSDLKNDVEKLIEYLDAERIFSLDSFKNYLEKYPESINKEKAIEYLNFLKTNSQASDLFSKATDFARKGKIQKTLTLIEQIINRYGKDEPIRNKTINIIFLLSENINLNNTHKDEIKSNKAIRLELANIYDKNLLNEHDQALVGTIALSSMMLMEDACIRAYAMKLTDDYLNDFKKKLENGTATADELMRLMSSPAKISQPIQTFNNKIIEDIATLISIYSINKPLIVRFKILNSIKLLCDTFDVKGLLKNAELENSLDEHLQQEKNLVLKSMVNGIIESINSPG